MANTNRTILITGVTRGLGRALAERFVEAGHHVVGCGRSRQRIDELRTRWQDDHDFDAVDVSSAAQVDRWAERVIATTGAPDLLINNAAIINANKPLWKVSAADFSNVIDVNIKGVANVIRAFVPAMIDRGRGVIVNLSSGWGRSTSPEVAPYCTTKWAVEGLTRALSQELPDGLAAVALNPGTIDTDMLQSCFGAAASIHQSPEKWSQTAAPFLLKLGPGDNGKALTAP